MQALIRWDPATFADRELAEREELRFPPAARMASVAGPAAAVDALLAIVQLPRGAEVLGPLPAAPGQPGRTASESAGQAADGAGSGPDAIRYLVRVPRSEGTELALSLRAAQAVRTAAKEPGPVRVQLDPAALI